NSTSTVLERDIKHCRTPRMITVRSRGKSRLMTKAQFPSSSPFERPDRELGRSGSIFGLPRFDPRPLINPVTCKLASSIQATGVDHDRTLRLPAQPARLQGDGDCDLSGHRADLAYARSDQGRPKVAGIRRAQSQHADANLEGWRLCAVGIKRHHAIPREQAAGERSAPVRRKRATRRDALAILGPRALGSYLRGISVRNRR